MVATINHNLSECCSCVFQRVDSDSEESVGPRRKGRRSRTLKVAMKFPTRRATQKTTAAEPSKQPKKESDSKEGGFMDKRALNIKENKAMVGRAHSQESFWQLPAE